MPAGRFKHYRERGVLFRLAARRALDAQLRAYHWKAVRAAAGWQGSLYLATRHFAGWYMVNELEMPSEDVAIALGHQDDAVDAADRLRDR